MIDTITQRQLDEIAHDQAVYAQMEYELRPFGVRCELCERTAYAPEKSLRKMGWVLGRGEEYCPYHRGS